MRLAGLVTALLIPCSLAALGACYNVNGIENGGLVCGGNRGQSCPSGYTCAADRHCWKPGSGPDGGGVSACTLANTTAPYGPYASCTVQIESSSTCDPVCQAGCPCGLRCGLESSSFSCQQPESSNFLNPFDPCSTDDDQCKPGSVCLREPVPAACGAHCYSYCRSDLDCPSDSRCMGSINVGDKTASEKIKTCSPPIASCSPVAGGSEKCGNNRAGFACYIFSRQLPDSAMCDCAGTIAAGQSCTDLHSCEPGHECVNGACRKVCLLSAGAAACGTKQCSAFNGSTTWGTCP